LWQEWSKSSGGKIFWTALAERTGVALGLPPQSKIPVVNN